MGRFFQIVTFGGVIALAVVIVFAILSLMGQFELITLDTPT